MKCLPNLNNLCPNIKGIHVDGHSKEKNEHTQYNNWVDKLSC